MVSLGRIKNKRKKIPLVVPMVVFGFVSFCFCKSLDLIISTGPAAPLRNDNNDLNGNIDP